MITRAVLITMSVAFAYIILVVGLMLWCRYRRQARKARLNLIDKDTVENGGGGGNGDLKMGEIEPCLPSDKQKSKKMNGHSKVARGEGGAGAESNNDTAASTNSKVSKKSSNFDQITMSRAGLFELVQIGRGEFGDVFVGKIKTSDLRKNMDEDRLKVDTNEKGQSKTSLNDISECKEESSSSESTQKVNKEIVVKALNNVKDENVCIEFRRQIEMFRAISHKCVSKLYGLCRDKDPHYLVLEYTDLGDLKQFLKSQETSPLTIVQLLNIAWQIGRGMDAIYRARYIHKDLATRNCLISSGYEVKVSYPGLHKDTYSAEYYQYNNTVVPLRWLAPECLNDDDYSTKSDVFAYAVLVWEIFTNAKALPMEHLSNEEFLGQLKENKLEWKLAEQTPPEIATLLVS